MTRRSFLGIGARSSVTCPPKPLMRKRARQRADQREIGLLRPAASEVSAPVFTSTATSARVGSMKAVAPPGRARRGEKRGLDRFGRAMGLETTGGLDHFVGIGVGPVAPCRQMGVGRVEQAFGRALGVGG